MSERCEKDPNGVHSFYDFTSWGVKHPKCSLCGFEDENRQMSETKPLDVDYSIYQEDSDPAGEFYAKVIGAVESKP